MTPQELSDRLWQFAARIAKVVDALPDTRVGRHVAGQIRQKAATRWEIGPTSADNQSQIYNDQFSIEKPEIIKCCFTERS